jgi:hypothetical protein
VRKWQEDVCAARVTSSQSLQEHTRSEESTRKIRGEKTPSGHIRFINSVSCNFMFSAGADDWTTSVILKHTSFIGKKYRDQNSAGPSSLTVVVPVQVGSTLNGGCRLRVHSQVSSEHHM